MWVGLISKTRLWRAAAVHDGHASTGVLDCQVAASGKDGELAGCIVGFPGSSRQRDLIRTGNRQVDRVAAGSCVGSLDGGTQRDHARRRAEDVSQAVHVEDRWCVAIFERFQVRPMFSGT